MNDSNSTQQEPDFEKRLLAEALYGIRLLLADHLDREEHGPVASAAWLAYALHNHALAALEDRPFDVTQALDAIDKLEYRLGREYVRQFRKTVLGSPSGA